MLASILSVKLSLAQSLAHGTWPLPISCFLFPALSRFSHPGSYSSTSVLFFGLHPPLFQMACSEHPRNSNKSSVVQNYLAYLRISSRLFFFQVSPLFFHKSLTFHKPLIFSSEILWKKNSSY